jgi:hypothetical protein
MIPQVYFISGLGADHRLYEKQIAAGLPIKVIDWKIPFPNESIEGYAKRMADEISPTNQCIFIGGVSFGGIMAIEMHKHISNAKIIIISSIKSSIEIPLHIKMWKYFPIYKILSGTLIKKAGILAKFIFGSMEKEDVKVFTTMVSEADPVFIKWAMHQIVNWKNKKYPDNILHIHGSKDLIFPIIYLKKPFTKIMAGTHIMIRTQSDEINFLLTEEINKGS